MAGSQKVGDDVLAEVVGGIGVLLVGNQELPQHLPGEYIDAHGGIGGLGNLGLFLELVDRAVGVGVHDAEAAGLLQGDVPHGDGAAGAGLLMEGYHGGVVHLVDVVAAQHHHVLRGVPVNEAQVLVDGVGGTLVPAALLVVALVGGQHLGTAVGLVQTPGLAVADVFVQLQRLILGEDSHGVNAGVDTVGQGEINDAVFAAKGDGRLGSVLGQNLQTAALAACQKHGNTTFFLEVHRKAPLLF